MAKPTRHPIHNARGLAAAALTRILAEQRGMEEVWADLLRQSRLRDSEVSWARHALLTSLRYKGPIDHWIATRLKKPLGESALYVQCVLTLGVVELSVMREPPHAVVNENVELVKSAGFSGLAGMVNAVLKKASAVDFAREEGWIPSWWVRLGVEEKGIGALLKAGKPPLDLHFVPDSKLIGETLGGEAVLPDMQRLHESGDVPSLSGYDEGAWWVQDVAASLPVRMLGDVKGKRVLDLCAAPGGKTAQLCAAGAEVVALDRSKRRMNRLAENMQRLGFAPEVVAADALEWQPDALFDAILLDAPCSASGTFRRNPDVLWTRDRDGIAALAELQRDIAAKAAEWLKPGGVLVYAVCSLFPQEGEAQAEWIAQECGLRLAPMDAAACGLRPEWVNDAGALRTHPAMMLSEGGMDGFFAAAFTKPQ